MSSSSSTPRSHYHDLDFSPIAALPELLAHGADQTNADGSGRITLDLACERGGSLDAVYELVKDWYWVRLPAAKDHS